MSEATAKAGARGAAHRGLLGRRVRRQLPRLGRMLVVPVLIVVVWEAGARHELFNPIFFPPPSAIVLAAKQLLLSGELLGHFADSLRRIALANLTAIAVAVPLGFLMGLSRYFEELMDGVVALLRPIPPLAWIPLAILWFGIGEKSVVFITLISAFFAILINTIAGVRSVERSLVRAALSLGASRRVLVTHVVLPATLPHLFTGFRIALGVSWMSIVAAELIAASSGLGFMISYYRELLRTDLILVGMLSIGVVGFLMDRGLLWLEGRLLPWRTRLQL